MSDHHDDNKVLIKFEIHVPLGVGVSPVIVNSPPGAVAPKPAHGGIDQPVACAKVKTTSPNTNGVICVSVTEAPDAFGRLPVDVYCKIISANDPIPRDPTAAGVGATHVPPNSTGSYSNWHLNELGTAQCAWAGSCTELPFNELVVWRKYPSENFWTIEVRAFRGQCATTTDCSYSAAGAVAQVFDTIPAAIEVISQGFGGKLEPLNGRWLLPRVERTAAGEVIWSCGGDGESHPRVQLHGQSCGDQPMSLELACAGQRLVYTLERAAFRPLGENRFFWSRQESIPRDCSFPTQLVVIPARGES